MMRPVAISESPPKRSDIVIVPFPCADQFVEKRRPALLVSSDGFNRKHGLLWVAMITSAGGPAGVMAMLKSATSRKPDSPRHP